MVLACDRGEGGERQCRDERGGLGQRARGTRGASDEGKSEDDEETKQQLGNSQAAAIGRCSESLDAVVRGLDPRFTAIIPAVTPARDCCAVTPRSACPVCFQLKR